MLLVYFGLEASFAFNKSSLNDAGSLPEDVLIYESAPPSFTVEKTEEIVLIKKKTVKSLDKFKVIENDNRLSLDRPEFIQKPTEGPDIDHLNPEAIPVIEETPEEKIPYIAVEDKPIFPGCEKVAKIKRESCFQEKIRSHVRRSFRYPEVDMNLGNHSKVDVFFNIDKEGKITDIEMKGPAYTMELEAQRIIKKLPQMTPG